MHQPSFAKHNEADHDLTAGGVGVLLGPHTVPVGGPASLNKVLMSFFHGLTPVLERYELISLTYRALSLHKIRGSTEDLGGSRP